MIYVSCTLPGAPGQVHLPILIDQAWEPNGSLGAAGVLVPPEGPPDGPGEFSGVLRYRAGALVDVVHAEGEVLSRYRERRPLREGWPFHQKVHRVEADVHHRRP